jgi:hypothetical protein
MGVSVHIIAEMHRNTGLGLERVPPRACTRPSQAGRPAVCRHPLSETYVSEADTSGALGSQWKLRVAQGQSAPCV